MSGVEHLAAGVVRGLRPPIMHHLRRQQTNPGRDPIGALRLERRFVEDAQWRRARFGDPVTLDTLQFSIGNCVIRRRDVPG